MLRCSYSLLLLFVAVDMSWDSMLSSHEPCCKAQNFHIQTSAASLFQKEIPASKRKARVYGRGNNAATKGCMFRERGSLLLQQHDTQQGEARLIDVATGSQRLGLSTTEASTASATTSPVANPQRQQKGAKTTSSSASRNQIRPANLRLFSH